MGILSVRMQEILDENCLLKQKLAELFLEVEKLK